jgi:hypothetical protein
MINRMTLIALLWGAGSAALVAAASPSWAQTASQRKDTLCARRGGIARQQLAGAGSSGFPRSTGRDRRARWSATPVTSIRARFGHRECRQVAGLGLVPRPRRENQR